MVRADLTHLALVDSILQAVGRRDTLRLVLEISELLVQHPQKVAELQRAVEMIHESAGKERTTLCRLRRHR